MAFQYYLMIIWKWLTFLYHTLITSSQTFFSYVVCDIHKLLGFVRHLTV